MTSFHSTQNQHQFHCAVVCTNTPDISRLLHKVSWKIIHLKVSIDSAHDPLFACLSMSKGVCYNFVLVLFSCTFALRCTPYRALLTRLLPHTTSAPFSFLIFSGTSISNNPAIDSVTSQSPSNSNMASKSTPLPDSQALVPFFLLVFLSCVLNSIHVC